MLAAATAAGDDCTGVAGAGDAPLEELTDLGPDVVGRGVVTDSTVEIGIREAPFCVAPC